MNKIKDDFYHFDIYKKVGLLRKRVKVVFEGNDYYVPEKQMKRFQLMIEKNPQKLENINNGKLRAVVVSDEVYLKMSYENGLLTFKVDRDYVDFTFMVKMH